MSWQKTLEEGIAQHAESISKVAEEVIVIKEYFEQPDFLYLDLIVSLKKFKTRETIVTRLFILVIHGVWDKVKAYSHNDKGYDGEDVEGNLVVKISIETRA